jgi:FAD:protein FMN transferase
MGMPVTVEIVDTQADEADLDDVFAYFQYIDETFSTYKPDSEISRLNEGRLSLADASADTQTIFQLAEATRQQTHGYFDIARDGRYDPSGIVKGWAIATAAEQLRDAGFVNYYVDAGGDIQVSGHNPAGKDWRVGIRNPFNLNEIVKVLAIRDCGVATSGTYVRGQHIYNPHGGAPIVEVLSLTVIARSVYDADRFATAAFAMGSAGINFIQDLDGFEGYMIDSRGRATFTGGFEKFVLNDQMD